MFFDRFAAKFSARESMRLNRPHATWVTLVYYLLTSILFAVVSAFATQDLTQYYLSLLASGFPVEEVVSHMFQEYRAPILLALAIRLVWRIYETLMAYGYTSYALRLARNEQPGFGHLFDGFARCGRVLWAAILEQVFILLWSLVVVLPLCAFTIFVGYTTQEYDAILGATFLTIFAGMMTAIVISFRYRLTSYFLLDHPNCTAREAIGRSVAAMRGRKMTLFLLVCSFIGWMLLSAAVSMLLSLLLPIMVSNVLCIWILPYYKATEANFYDFVTGAATSDDRLGPNYEQTTDGPVPF